MAEITLDGENVEFAGSAPASLSAVRTALEETLAAQGRVLADLRVDGQPFDESLGNQPPAPGARIVATSLSMADALAQVGAALGPEIIAQEARAQALAREVLRTPWPEIQTPCVQTIETIAEVLQRAAEVATLRGEESPAAHAVGAVAQAVEQWMQAVQQRDAAGVALHLDGAVAPALAALAAALDGKAGA